MRAAPRYRTPRVDDGLAIIVDYVKNELPPSFPPMPARRRGCVSPAIAPCYRCSMAQAAPRRGGAARSPRRRRRTRPAGLDHWQGPTRARGLLRRRRARGAAHLSGPASRRLRAALHSTPRRAARSGARRRAPAPLAAVRVEDRQALRDRRWRHRHHHGFRHLKATSLLNRGANLSHVQDILGHASPDTTKRIYAHYETAHLREVFDRFSVPVDEASAPRARRRRSPEELTR